MFLEYSKDMICFLSPSHPPKKKGDYECGIIQTKEIDFSKKCVKGIKNSQDS